MRPQESEDYAQYWNLPEMEEHSLTLVRSPVLETFRQEGLYTPAFAGHARGRSAKAENPDNNSGIKKLKNKEKQGTKVCYGSLLQLSRNLLKELILECSNRLPASLFGGCYCFNIHHHACHAWGRLAAESPPILRVGMMHSIFLPYFNDRRELIWLFCTGFFL